MRYLLSACLLCVAVGVSAEELPPGLVQGGPITKYELANGSIKSYWDAHGNNVQVYSSPSTPGLSTYSSPSGSGTIHEPFYDRRIAVPEPPTSRYGPCYTPNGNPVPGRC